MKLWGYNGKIIGNMIGNDGNRMGNTQRFTKFFLGSCQFTKWKLQEKNRGLLRSLWEMGSEKVYTKTTSCSTVNVCYTRSLFCLLLSDSQNV